MNSSRVIDSVLCRLGLGARYEENDEKAQAYGKRHSTEEKRNAAAVVVECRARAQCHNAYGYQENAYQREEASIEKLLVADFFRGLAGLYEGLCEFIYVDVGIHFQGLDEYLGALLFTFYLGKIIDENYTHRHYGAYENRYEGIDGIAYEGGYSWVHDFLG